MANRVDTGVPENPPERGDSSTPRAYFLPALAFSAIILGYIVFNAAVLLALNHEHDDNEYVLSFVVGSWVFQAISFGMWLAMGTGTFFTRLPFTLASACLIYTVMGLAQGSLRNIERVDFFAMVAGSSVIFCLSFILFKLVRWLTRYRIVHVDSPKGADRGKVRFNLRYLLALMTVFAICLGMVSQLKFISPPHQTFFGPEFVYYIMIVGGACVAGVVLPATVVPFFVLQGQASKRALKYAIGFWLAVIFLTVIIWELNDPQPLPDVLVPIGITQFGAAITGVVAAMVLRFFGFRLKQMSRGSAGSAA
jgi:hypothetical protein